MKRVIDALTPEEALAIKNSFTGHFAVRNRALVKLMLNTGLRISEALALNVSDVIIGSQIADEIVLRAETTKTKKARYVPLNQQAMAAITDVIKFNLENGFPIHPDAPLFVSKKSTLNHRLSAKAFQHIIRLNRSSMKSRINITSHCFRHTFITRVYQKTKDLQIVQELAGHSNITTTQKYMHRSRDEKKRAVAMLCGVSEAMVG